MHLNYILTFDIKTDFNEIVPKLEIKTSSIATFKLKQKGTNINNDYIIKCYCGL